MKDDDCFLELFKLQKMFETSFNIKTKENENKIENVYNKESVKVNILFKPTDPEFDKSLLSTPEGIEITLNLYRISDKKTIDEQKNEQEYQKNINNDKTIKDETNKDNIYTYYEIRDIEDVKVNDPGLPELIKKSIQKVLLDYTTKNRKIRKYVIYESLKFLDKNFVKICQISNSFINKQTNDQETTKELTNETKKLDKRENTENPWTLEEQKALEDGLVRSKGIADPREKWLFISKIVKTRTADECRKRFLRLSELIVKKNKVPETQEPEPSYSVERSSSLSFTSLEMTKLSLGRVGTFSMELICVRCSHHFEVTMTDTGEKSTVCSTKCDKCLASVRCEFTPSLFFPSQLIFGRLSLSNANFIDLNNSEFKLTCEDCETQIKLRDVKIGDKKSLNCRGCFVKSLFTFEGVQFGEQEPPLRETGIRKVLKFETKKAPQPKGIKAGTPLPANGTCKHYKKSFRWFRFPCCGRLFPCDICHDDVSDHKCGHANFIVCGFCSTQQASSNKVCKFCTKGYTGSSSSHWEVCSTHSHMSQGGKGCRDGTKLSRKDSKKYKLMGKK